MKQSKAKGRVLLATDRLAASLPLHGGILARWRLEEDESIDTMAIGFCRGRLVLYMNSQFVERLSMDELTAVLSHEANHVLFGHCEQAPVEGENKTAMMSSMEVTTNEWAIGPLPGNPILLKDFPTLPPNEDTMTRYERLRAIIPDPKDTLDDHSRWEQLRSSGQLSKAVINTIIAKVWGQLTPEQRAKAHLPKQVQQVVNEALTSAGTAAVGEGTATVPWRVVLRRYIGKTLVRRSMFTRPSRRFPHLIGIVPGKGRSGSKPKIVVVVDSSGSVSSSMLAAFSAELVQIAKAHDVTVIEADDTVRAVYRFKGPLTSVSGRGSTNFGPAIQEASKVKPDLLIYATDGHGKAPATAPRFPVIWLLTPGGRKPAVWGQEVRIS